MKIPIAKQRISSISAPTMPIARDTSETEIQAIQKQPNIGGAILGAGEKIGKVIEERQLEKMRQENDILINDSKSNFLKSTTTFLSDPKTGILNRSMQDSMGSTKETQDWLDKRKEQYGRDLTSPYAKEQFNKWFEQHSNTTLNTVAKYENKQIDEADKNARTMVRQNTIQTGSLMPDNAESVKSYYEQGLESIKKDGDEALNRQNFVDDYYSAVILSGVDDSAKNSRMRFNQYELALSPKTREAVRQRIQKSERGQKEVNIAQEAFNKYRTASDLAYQEIDKLTEDQDIRNKARKNYNILRNQEEVIKKESVISATNNLMTDVQNRVRTNTLTQNLNVINAEIDKKIVGTGGEEYFYPDEVREGFKYALDNPDKAFKVTDIKGAGKFRKALVNGDIKSKNDLLGYLPYLSPVDRRRAESEINIKNGDPYSAEFGVNPDYVSEAYKSMTGWGGDWFGAKSDLFTTNYESNNYNNFTNFVYEQAKDRKDLTRNDYNNYASSYFGKKVDEQRQKNIKIIGEAYNKPVQKTTRYREGQTAKNPKTGETLIFKNGVWKKQ